MIAVLSSRTSVCPTCWSLDSAAGAVAEKPKVCGQCGADLKGKKRYRDGDGYLCVDCHKLDKNRRVPCAECQKPTLPENLQPLGPVSSCRKCFMDHQRDPKTRVNRKVSTRHFDKHQKKQLIILVSILGAILLFILISFLAN